MFSLCSETAPQGFEDSDLSSLGLLSIRAGLPTSALLTFGADVGYFVVSAVLCIAACLTASLVSTY